MRAPTSASGRLIADREASQFQPTDEETRVSNFMEFLEKMGQDAQLRYATNNELEQALMRAQIDPAARAAVLAGDRRQLEVLLGATGNTCCGIFVPDDDEEAQPGIMMKNDGQGRALNRGTAAHQAAVA